MAAALAENGFVNEIDYAAVTAVEVGISAFRCEIEGVEREASVSSSRNQRIVYIVNGMSEGVGALDLKAVREALLQIHLKPGVGRVADGLVQRGSGGGEGGLEGIVVDSIEGEYSKFCAEPQVGKGQCTGCASESISRDAKGEQLDTRAGWGALPSTTRKRRVPLTPT